MQNGFFEDSYFVSVFKRSLICHIFASVAGWFSRQWNSSPIIGRITSQRCSPELSDASVLVRLSRWIYRLLRRFFAFLRLDRITEGSIFRKPWLWSGLALFAAPILPTKYVIVLVLAAFCTLFLDYVCGEERRLRYFPANKFVIAFAFIYMVSAFTSLSVSSSLYISALTAFFTLFFIVFASSVQSYRQLKTIAVFAVFAGVLVALYGFYQYLQPGQRTGAWVDSDLFDISFRVYSTLDNPNVLGEYFLLVIPLAVAFMFSARGWCGRILWLGCTGIMMLCLILTYSRGCWIGILAAAAIFLVMRDRRFIILGVVFLCAAPFILPENILQRISSVGNMADDSTSYRVYIWFGTIAMLRKYWFSGIGPGETAFNKIYPLYSYNSIKAPHAHNLFLQVTCDTGICGLIALVLAVFSCFRTLASGVKSTSDRESRIFQTAGIASIAGFMVQSMFDYTFYNYRVMLMLWAFMALYMLFGKFRRDGESEGAAHD